MMIALHVDLHKVQIRPTSYPVPSRLYHATPLYRYDPAATVHHGVWSVEKHGCIKGTGLLPRSDSSTTAPAVYLASEPSVAENYASGNFGEECAVEWVILEIDTSALDPALFVADLDQEARNAADDIVAAGYTVRDIDNGNIPWYVVMEATGQVKYTGSIPDSLLSVIKTLPAS